MEGTTDAAQATGEPEEAIEDDPSWEPGDANQF